MDSSSKIQISSNQPENQRAFLARQNRENIVAAVTAIKTELQESGKLENEAVKQQLGMIENLAHKLPEVSMELFKIERDRIGKICNKIRQSSNLNSLFENTVTTIREDLFLSRVLIYRFNNETSGTVIAESVAAGWTPAAKETLPVLIFGAEKAADYAQQPHGIIIKDIKLNGLTPYQLQLLDKFQVKTSIALPIILDGKVWGLLVAQQCEQANPWKETDISLLHHITIELTIILQPKELREQLNQQLEREKLLAKVVQKIQQSKDIDEIFKTTTEEVRKLLEADRTIIYQFNPDWSGVVVAESVGSGWVSLLIEQSKDEVLSGDRTTHDRCLLRKWAKGDIVEPDSFLRATEGGRYVRGQKITTVNDIYTMNFPDCYVESLEKYQAKAYVIVPIFQDEKLWGLLGCYQNSGTRHWQELESKLMIEMADQLAVALKQVQYVEELKHQSQKQAQAAEREKIKSTIINKIRQSPDIDNIFTVTVQEVRKVLKTDRTIIYQFNPDWSGQVVAESVDAGWVSLLVEQTDDEVLSGDRTTHQRCILRKWANGDIVEPDSFLRATEGGRYVRGQKVTTVNDIYAMNFPDCYVESLEKYQAKAYIIVPIFQDEKLWGLLGCYHNSAARHWQELESNLMLEIANQLAVALKQAQYVEELKHQSQQQAQAAEREKIKATIINKIRQSPDIDNIFTVTVQEVRKVLKTDRTIIYQFNPDWSGQVVAESVDVGWVSLLIEQTDDEVLSGDRTTHQRCILKKWAKGDIVEPDTFLKSTGGGRYIQGQKVTTVNDIYAMNFPDCYVESLEKYQAKAYIIVPIFQDEKLWGLLGCYHNSAARHWQELESNLMLEIANQLAVALKQAQYVEELKYKAQQQIEATQREKTKATIINKIRESHNTDQIFSVTVQEVRKVLKTDRTIIYQFNPDWTGQVVAESVDMGWVSLLVEQTNDEVLSGDRTGNQRCLLRKWANGDIVEPDSFLKSTEGGRYARGQKVTTVNDIYTMNFPDCYIESLEKYQAKAYIIVPIFQGEKLWGLLGCYQNSGARHWQESEVDLLIQLSSPLGIAIKQAEYVAQLQQQTKQEQATTKIINQIRKSFDLNTILQITTQEIRSLLQADRALVYHFNTDWSGKAIVESCDPKWASVMEIQQVDTKFYKTHTTLYERCTVRELSAEDTAFDTDTYLKENKGGGYSKGRKIAVVNNVYTQGFTPCYLEFLEKYQAKAYIIAPIFHNEKLWGLLAVYQNSSARNWQDGEIQITLNIASQLTIAVQQAQYVQQLKNQSQQLETVANRERGLARMSERLRRTHSLETVLQMASRDGRKLLNVERVAICRFTPEDTLKVLAETAVSGLMKSMAGVSFANSIEFKQIQQEPDKENDCVVVNDIYQVELEEAYLEELEQFEIKAYIITPIFLGQKLWGLIAAYQHSEARIWEEGQINTLKQIGLQVSSVLQEISYIKQVRTQSENLAKATERESNFIRLLAKINQKIIEQSQEQIKLDSLFRTSSQELRKILKADRVGVLQFNPDWSGQFVAEDVGSGYLKLVGTEQAILKDPEIQENRGGRYRNQQNLVINDVDKADISATELEFIEELGVKACLVIPIFKGEQLWGLLATYQNDRTRNWEEGEINLLVQASVQLGVAIQQGEYLKQVQAQSQQLAETVEREKAAKEEIQHRVIELLSAVQPAATGDLTVRASVTEDEVGTIAAAYNSTLDALREIVSQVQSAAGQVTQTTSGSTTAIERLAIQAQEQFEELNQALSKIQEMVKATESTTENAQQVGVAIKQANQTLQAGDTAMNKTVNSILGIRQTVTETSKRVKRLRESSQKISKVVSLINDFAKQTNLLALNAALEATRAGEYGKGFAVVAAEVRNLSDQSAEATTEIEKLVLEIQNETQEVASAMDAGIQQVSEGTNFVNETRENLNAIVTATAQINQLVEGITQASSLQTQQAEVVTQVMTEVAGIANDTSSDSLSISASFKELLVMAQQLQASADQFKVH